MRRAALPGDDGGLCPPQSWSPVAMLSCRRDVLCVLWLAHSLLGAVAKTPSHIQCLRTLYVPRLSRETSTEAENSVQSYSEM